MLKDNLESLSDVELHQELLKCGLPNLAVTETTRKILIQKLRIHQNRHSKESSNHKHIQGSSINSVDQNFGLSSSQLRSVTKRADKCSASMVSSYNVENKNTLISSNNFNDKCLTMPQRITHYPKMYAPPPILASESEEDSDYLSQSACKNMRKRLLSFRDSTIRKKGPSSPIYTNESEAGLHHKAALSTVLATSFMKPRNLISHLMNCFNVHTELSQNLVPYFLICVFVLFFVFIGFMYYIIITPDLATINEKNTYFNICSDSDQRYMKTHSLESCIERDYLERAILFNSELLRLLQERSKRNYCGDLNKSASISASDVINYLDRSQVLQKALRGDMLRLLQAAAYLIKSNPQWRITIRNSDETTPSLPSVMSLKDIDKFFPNREIYFTQLQQRLPIMCIFYNKIQNFFVIIGTGSIFGLIFLFCYIAYRYFRMLHKDRYIAVEQFTVDIINELIFRASIGKTSDEREVIINHLRDKLIPLNKRKRSSYMWSWNEALSLLEANDSRIQFGVTICNGVEFRTMKWIENALPPDSRDRNNTKQWQSPAFDNTNKIVNPPTACLKIRHMFDSSEIKHPDLKQIIETAILEKVGSRCNIHDIQIDSQSCCVYVRCATEEDAGIAHNEINGWWFDKRLVSIKFVRLQRYLSRFPKSSNLTSILHPNRTHYFNERRVQDGASSDKHSVS